ncbi:MAG: hypothetical protein JGK17_02800 [Microcoleus sp. PH2017_10_PVI_O_A]|uniref:hypothetical protein n=1 Tax=unclassified Microcoleus TaxID=2642155 RepID=UPI001E112EF2|nr:MULTISPECIES: hypothetical protein [unclassified Microcoleus]TAE83459.1 MAG: hypothetical protein EAZ83_09175 [Oscillatoriales cyanobacterium]MCC3404515.1 hypothetical protein [Microcoleus sp. PH2017_10_PVI_O_A]MCC3458583.1 hypothetical protein [Microcoleus sp. PH2017_11_PCY_U_A]MCC3476833.1 hypothetical protein [Microcoleus sp. PH2017_12_PCY_D_A]MCC3559161.1 hypothetical protein [Microcoleus sp. PH2017_27_LUM_O_A]
MQEPLALTLLKAADQFQSVPSENGFPRRSIASNFKCNYFVCTTGTAGVEEKFKSKADAPEL